MKKLSIILISALVALAACTKNKEVHPEIGDGNDEIVTVGMKDVHVEYARTDHAELSRVVFHYSLSEEQQFEAAEMTKREDFFELTLNDLVSDTLYNYYYELFPKSGSAVVTDRKTFHTQAYVVPEPPSPPSGAPEGAINGLFTINANGDQVYFSQGNLQYQASTNTWRFADKQWDFVGTQVPDSDGNVGGTVIGSSNHLISNVNIGWIDLFGFGTSGWDNGNTYYQPWDSDESDALLYGPLGEHDLTGSYSNADWGVYNLINNGGNTANQWRVLTKPELVYIFNTRNTPSNIRYTKAKVNDVNGIILLPDNWNLNTYYLNNTNTNNASFSDNVISASQWSILELAGAVFFPAAGTRVGTFIFGVGLSGVYWSASHYDSGNAYSVSFYELDFHMIFDGRCGGHSVRLVQDANL